MKIEFDPRTPVKTITKSPDVKKLSGSKAKGILTKKFTANSPVKQIVLTPVKKSLNVENSDYSKTVDTNISSLNRSNSNTSINSIKNNITKTKIEQKNAKILPKPSWNSGLSNRNNINSRNMTISRGPLATSNTKFTRGSKPMAGKVGNKYNDLNKTVRGRK